MELNEDDVFCDEVEYTECIDGKYYVGCYVYDVPTNILLLVLKIKPSTFLAYGRNILLKYFYYYSWIRQKPNMEIVQVNILEDGTYSCVVKTRYLRMIQKKWREIYRNRQEFIKSINLKQLHRREITGRFSKAYC